MTENSYIHVYYTSRFARGLVVQLVSAIVTLLLHSNVDIHYYSTEFSKQVWQRTVAEPLALREAQWPSMRVRWQHSHSAHMWLCQHWHERLVLGSRPSLWGQGILLLTNASPQSPFFCTRPYCSAQSGALGHKHILSEIFFVYKLDYQ